MIVFDTADWALRASANDLPTLFTEAARGMNRLSGAQPAAGARLSREFKAIAPEVESLLVLFLSELVYSAEQEKLVFDTFEIEVNGTELIVILSGAPIYPLTNPSKPSPIIICKSARPQLVLRLKSFSMYERKYLELK
jgi:SHS2 domain-containing protein